MRYALLRGAALALACVLLCGAATDEGPKLRTLERELNSAIAQRDANRVNDLLSDDWLLVTGSGRVKTKRDVLAEIARSDLQFQDNDTRDVMVRIWGDTAVLTGTLHQRYKLRGVSQDVTFRYTDTWARTGDSWRQVSGHVSRLPD